MWINHGRAAAGRNALERKRSKEGRFAHAGFTNRVDMGEPVPIRAVRTVLAASGSDDPSIAERWFTFLYRDGRAVGDFRLVVDRSDASALAGLCGEGQRAISPTQVELRRTNWRPQGRLEILFLALAPAE